MYAAIWRFAGDPDDLGDRYSAMIGELGNPRLQLCLRAADGIVLVDTCPSREAFEAFAGSDSFRQTRERHGLPEPESVDGFDVRAAFADGRPIS